MMSRGTAILLAEVYENGFAGMIRIMRARSPSSKYVVNSDSLYDYLFIRDYPAWFCNLARGAHGYRRVVKDLIMRLHTGESIAILNTNQSGQQIIELGQSILRALAKDILNYWNSLSDDHSREKLEPNIVALLRNLELDGFVYRNSELLIPESDVLDVQHETGVLESLFVTLGLGNKETVLYHLALSEQHYTAGKWSDSISNSRKFLEAVLQETASAHSLRCKKSPLPHQIFIKPVAVRDYLLNEGLLEAKEKEALAAIYGLLSTTGSHPYMAENDQARLLRHLALTSSQFVMLRLQGALK